MGGVNCTAKAEQEWGALLTAEGEHFWISMHTAFHSRSRESCRTLVKPGWLLTCRDSCGAHATSNRDLPSPLGTHRTMQHSVLLLRQTCGVQSFFAGILQHCIPGKFLVPVLLLGWRACLGLLSHKTQILSSTLMLFVTSLDFHLMPLSLI